MNDPPSSTPNPSVPGRLELPVRAASAVIMAIAAAIGLLLGGVWFSLVIALGGIASLREWHRLVNEGRLAREMLFTGLAVISAISLVLLGQPLGLAAAAVAAGAALAAISAALRMPPASRRILWHAAGAFYIGLPALALVMMRGQARGTAIIGALFVAVWTADTGALLLGRLIGGPKLAPHLSPNKTWAGFVGGTLAASIGEMIYVAILGGMVLEALVLGFCLALAGHCGDLFESWVKRQFHAKNTGRLIPGHGGMLDRVDSLLFAAPVCAMLVFLLKFDPFGPLP